MPEKMRILAVGAHPDDLESLCGGTLARYAAAGHVVVMANLTAGDKGHMTMTSEELARVRRAEAEEAGKIIGAEVITLDLPDAQLVADEATRVKVIDLVRRARPDVVITLSPRDYSGDHVTASRLVCDASFVASAPLVRTSLPHTTKVPPVYFCDTAFGVNSDATIYVDISETFETKMRMLACHRSQHVWLKDHTGADFLDDVRCVARYRGLQCGVRYAEAFSELHAWPRKIPARLLP